MSLCREKGPKVSKEDVNKFFESDVCLVFHYELLKRLDSYVSLLLNAKDINEFNFYKGLVTALYDLLNFDFLWFYVGDKSGNVNFDIQEEVLRFMKTVIEEASYGR